MATTAGAVRGTSWPAGAAAGVAVEDHGAVRHVCLDRPAAGNALTPALIAALHGAFDAAAQDPGVHAILVRGAGPSFCAGLDPETLDELATYPAQIGALGALAAATWLLLEQSPKPTIAEIHGRCAGAGLELALACDLRVAAGDAQLALPQLRCGMVPGGGTAARLPSLIGLGRAKELVMAGRAVGGDEAQRIGLVTRTAPAGALRAATQALLDELALSGPVALGQAKRVLDAAAKPGAAAAAGHEAAAQQLCAQTVDFAEGTGALRARRRPTFLGC
jgi:enoyl-CoA hydratase/carnithine racemase